MKQLNDEELKQIIIKSMEPITVRLDKLDKSLVQKVEQNSLTVDEVRNVLNEVLDTVNNRLQAVERPLGLNLLH